MVPHLSRPLTPIPRESRSLFLGINSNHGGKASGGNGVLPDPGAMVGEIGAYKLRWVVFRAHDRQKSGWTVHSMSPRPLSPARESSTTALAIRTTTSEIATDGGFRHFNHLLASSTLDYAHPKTDSFEGNCMKVAALRLSLAGRVFAVAWLFVWLTAQTLCVHHCASLAVAKSNGGGCCAKKAPKAATDSGDFPCSSLKTVKLEPKAVMAEFTTVNVVPFQPDFVLPLPATHLDPSLAHYVRALPRADSVFEPKVSLGAALRSLAPPALA